MKEQVAAVANQFDVTVRAFREVRDQGAAHLLQLEEALSSLAGAMENLSRESERNQEILSQIHHALNEFKGGLATMLTAKENLDEQLKEADYAVTEIAANIQMVGEVQS